MRAALCAACVLFVLVSWPVRADEYAAARLGRYARYVKQARETDLSFLAGQSVPGVFVNRHRHTHHTDWSYERDRWLVVLHVTHPPDELTSGVPVTVPLEVRVEREGDDPLDFTVRASVRGVFRGRVAVVPGRVIKKRRGDPATVQAGKLVFTPRLDWDFETIGIEIAFADAAGTDWVVARYAWWSNQLEEQYRIPRRRDLDPVKP